MRTASRAVMSLALAALVLVPRPATPAEFVTSFATDDAASLDPSDRIVSGDLRPCSLPDSPLTTVIPQEIDDPLVNPYCGWGIWAGPRFFDSRQFSIDYNTQGFGDDAPLFSWVLIDWMWSDLEPKEGQFQWDDLDTVVDYWKARNKQLVVRLWVTSDPGWAGAAGNKACPDWLWDAGVKYHSYKGEGGVAQRSPAYADPTWETYYLPRLKRFLTAYRDRYHNPGNPIILDHVMGFGDWGEWHTMWSHYPWPSSEKKREVLGKAIEAYLDVFAPNQPANQPVRNLAIAHVYDDDCGGELPLEEALHRQSLDIAIGKGLALTRNGFIDGLGGWPNDLMDKYWKDHQLIAESNWSYEQVKRDKTHGTMAEHVDAFSRWHSAYAHLYMHADSYKQAMTEDRGEFERALQPGGIGYRFVLTSASWEPTRQPGQTLTLGQEWANRNSSWCVQPYRLQLYLVDREATAVWAGIDSAFDPRPWTGGQAYPVESRFRLPEDLKPGTYELRIALVDESGTPRVRLAIAGADAALRYRLGELEITPVAPRHAAVSLKSTRSPWSDYRFAPDAISEIDLASDTAWTLSIDEAAQRPIKVPAGGWNSENQIPPLDTWRDVQDHVVYRTKLAIPAQAAGKCVKLLLGAVNYGAEILIDGHKVSEHVGCMTPISIDLTDIVTPGKTHELQVKAFHRKHYGFPVCTVPVGFDVPAGCGIEGQGQTKYGYGINGYARLALYPLVHIEDVFVRTSVSEQTLTYNVSIANHSPRTVHVVLNGSLSPWSGSAIKADHAFHYPAIADQTIEIPAGGVQKLTIAAIPWNLGPASYWWPNIPYQENYTATLHWLNLSVTEAGQVLHERKQRFGFVEHAEGPFYYTVNGVRYTGIGDSVSHGQVGDYDCFYETLCFQPSSGSILGCPETWRRYQRIGFNSIRTSISVPSRYMLDTADEAGYMLIVEGGNWFHQYSDYHSQHTPRQLQDTILACRNHPCVTRYSLANESIVKPADSPELSWRWLIDAALDIDDTRPLVFEENPGQAGVGIVPGMKRGHALRMQHYDPITQGGDRIRGMGEHFWETEGMDALAVGAPVLRFKDWTYFSPWSWINYWPNFLEGMSHDRHPWTQNNHADRRDGVDGWDSPIVAAVQRAFHPFLVVDCATLNMNPTIKEHSLDLTAPPPHQPAVYPAGSTLKRKFEVFNGELTGNVMELRWSARWDSADGPEVANGTVGPFEIEPGFHSAQTVVLEVPSPGRDKRALYLVLEPVKDGRVVNREDRVWFAVEDRNAR